MTEWIDLGATDEGFSWPAFLNDIPRITLRNRINKLKSGAKVWQWIVDVDGWPAAIGHTSALQCWFAMCSLEDA